VIFGMGANYERIVVSCPKGDYWPKKIACNMERNAKNRAGAELRLSPRKRF
jgi:hypothetical protein